MEWQPIETAPTTDEFRCLVYSREMDEVMIGAWTVGSHWESGKGLWSEVTGSEVEWMPFNRPITHWMPLPEPPE